MAAIVFEGNGKTSYSGSESYKQIDALLRNSGKLKIISPYISLFYARRLAELSKSRKIWIITSKPNSGADMAAFKYLTKLSNIMVFIKLFVYFAVMGAFAVLFGFYTAAFILLGIFLMAFAALRLKYGSIARSNIFVKTSKQFIHEKIYIGNSSAIVGSANLTYSGTHRNIEYIEVIREKEKIKSLEKHFDSLWSSL
ncbi:phospholipase D-like domain-containing protein [Candidatus Marsarchaeota archaeon]|nr:phospholipase D-like domain-containing protein [Candidatus Marsarchaeota archaeon]